MHLANPSAIKQYEGLKHSDDARDAFHLAELLKLGILPEGYIYPKEERPVRDLLRKRSQLVRQRTMNILSFKNLVSRNLGIKMSSNDIKKMREEDVKGLLKEEHLILAGRANIATMRFLADLLKKENGYPPRTLNILWTLCELAQVGRIVHAGKVIGDQALLRIAGFQAKEYTRLFKESIKHEIVKALRAGEDIEDVLNRI